MALTDEQQQVLDFDKQNLIVSASAGSGKTFVLIKYITNLILTKKVPLEKFLVLTFTKAAAAEMKERLLKAFLEEKSGKFLLEQIDSLPNSDICTIDSFCEKIIKQNLPKTQLDENFSLIDEKQSLPLMQKAFDRAIEEFSQNKPEQFGELFFAFKKNRKTIFECMQSLLQFFDSQEDEEYLLEKYIFSSQKIFDDACEFLNLQLKDQFIALSNQLFEFNSTEKDLQTYCKALQSVLATTLSEDYLENAKNLSQLSLPRMPSSKKDEQNKAILKTVASTIKTIISKCKKYDFSALSIQKQRNGDLSVAILTLFQVFCEKYKTLKKNYDYIDFADAEKIAKKLLQDQEILSSLWQTYAYIFVDEYQDTNKLQEKIIKPIAEKGRFVAVGDIKQGIYGFRNANMEIMLEDIENFSKDQNSQALFLKSNFRSDKKILNFVNFIFEKIMTKSSTGVDYKKTSILKGQQQFLPAKNPAVQVLLCPAKEEEKPQLQPLYSVQEDQLQIKTDGQEEARMIASKVKEFLNSSIYNPKTKKFEKVCPQDIAVLFRGRNKTMSLCYKMLLENGISVQSDAKGSPFDSPSVKVLASLLKLALSVKDDISLTSVLNSPFADFSLDEIARIAMIEGDSFHEKFEKSKEKNEKIAKFYQFLEDFKFNLPIKGAISQLKEEMLKCNFLERFSSQFDEKGEMQNIEDFFKLIKDLGAQFNIPRIVAAFDNLSVKTSAISQSENSVLLTTIHATKGLEYPIVILAGCGESFEKTETKSYVISRRFGLATNVYDNVTLTKSPSVVLNAVKAERKKRNWVDEIMIFYVALTRAKNHLVLTGQSKLDWQVRTLDECTSYFDLLLYCLGQESANILFSSGEWQTQDFCIKVQQNPLFEENFDQKRKILVKLPDKVISDYPFMQAREIELKNSVTELSSEKNPKIFENLGADREESIMVGNAMHKAMQLLDYDKISNQESLLQELEKFKDVVDLTLIDRQILLNNILTVKNLCKGGKIYKEKEFVMKMPALEGEGQDQIIVQGAIDFFVVKEDEVVLVDYKFTQSQNEQILRKRYEKQLDFYEKALQKAFPGKKTSKYLLSLKQSKLIKF